MTAGRTRRTTAAPFRRAARRWLLPAALAAALVEPCFAQARSTVSALPVQGLRFGVLSAAIPVAVPPADAARRAAVELVGSGAVTLTFQLPPALATDAGELLPVHFGALDGRVEFPRSNRVIEFDPNAPLSLTIPPGFGGAQIYLGGTASPRAAQPPGEYRGTITVHVVVANAAS